MEAIYNVEFFRDELNLISDPEIARLAEDVLVNAPKYIWYVPSSITGKYHPPDDNVPGGLCWHLKKTAWLGYRMFDNLMLDTDVGVVAGLTHDIAHRGLEDTPDDDYESYQKHGELAAHRLTQIMDDHILAWTMAIGCVASHMGRWGNCKPETIEQTTFHLADVGASTRGLVGVHYLTEVSGDEAWSNYSIDEIVGKKEYFKVVDGECVFNFGKLEGRNLIEVARENHSYLSWILKKGVASDDNPQGFPAYMIEQVLNAKKHVREERQLANESDQGNLFEAMFEGK